MGGEGIVGSYLVWRGSRWLLFWPGERPKITIWYLPGHLAS